MLDWASSSSLEVLISKTTFGIAKWALIRKEFSEFSFDDILSNSGACMGCCSHEERRSVPWNPSPYGVLKFNVDGASRGKPGPEGI